MKLAILLLKTDLKEYKAPPYILLQNHRTIIGRHGDVALDTINGKEISKFHAFITCHTQRDHDVWMIEDNDSLNGTFVNCRKIKRQILNHGDEVVFGGGSNFQYGDIIASTENAECKYRFYLSPPTVRFSMNVNPNSDVEKQSNLSCSICYQDIIAPETLPCGHTFCLTCIHEWANVCRHGFRPCICPLCRAVFSISELTPNEFILKNGELQVWSIDGMLRDLRIKNCKIIKGANIFKKWKRKHELWFWRSYNIVKPNEYRLITFLFLTEATPSYIFRAKVNDLIQALNNFNLEIPEEKTKDKLRYALLTYLFETLNPPPPDQPKNRKKVNFVV